MSDRAAKQSCKELMSLWDNPPDGITLSCRPNTDVSVVTAEFSNSTALPVILDTVLHEQYHPETMPKRQKDRHMTQLLMSDDVSDHDRYSVFARIQWEHLLWCWDEGAIATQYSEDRPASLTLDYSTSDRR